MATPFNKIDPDSWNNIALPLVQSFKSVLLEIRRIQQVQEGDKRRAQTMDRREADHYISMQKALKEAQENFKKDLAAQAQELREEKAQEFEEVKELIKNEIKQTKQRAQIMAKDAAATAENDARAYALKTAKEGFEKTKSDILKVVDSKETDCIKRTCIPDVVDYFRFPSDQEAQMQGMYKTQAAFLKDLNTKL